MGLPVLIIGKSGSGKTTSLRNLNPKKTLVFRLAKPLPKAINLQSLNLRNLSYTERYQMIKEYINKCYKKGVNTYVIDDSDYLMFFEQINRSAEGGYKKYTDIAEHMIKLLNWIDQTPDDIVVYFLNHTEVDNNTGYERAITAGKMIDNQIGTIEALYNEVIYACIKNGEYKFIVHSNGSNSAKTSWGMFNQDEYPNDLKVIDDRIRSYYEIDGGKKNEADKKA